MAGDNERETSEKSVTAPQPALITPENLPRLSDDELAKLIHLPPKVFQELLQQFGRDEVIALVVNIVATSVVGSLHGGDLLMAISGPVVEKGGLFLYPALKNFLAQKHLPIDEKKTMLQTVLTIWREGRGSLVRDLLLHDPMYTTLLLLEMQKLPGVSVALLSAIAFTISVLLTVSTEIGGREVLHRAQLERLERQGFVREQLYESRLVLFMTIEEAQRIFEELRAEFHFSEVTHANYHDTYYEEKAAQNGRKSKLRHRVRTEPRETEDDLEFASIQFLFEKLTKNKRGFYPTSKDKLRLSANDKRYDAYLKKLEKQTPIRDIYCSRDYMRSDIGVYVSCDQFSQRDANSNGSGESTITLEVKAHPGSPEAVRIQQEVIYYLISKYPQKVTETNQPKNVLVSSMKTKNHVNAGDN